MTKIKLVTDSSIQMTPEELDQYDVHVIPLTIMIDSTVYVDGETITREEFMAKMAAATALPKTSQPAIGTFLDMFDALTEDGSEVLAIHMLEAISGTVNSARQAAELAHGKVTVIDSDFTDRSMAFQVIEAAKMIQAGHTVDEIVARLAEIRANTKLVLGVSNLDNLVKGGRLSRVSGMISTLLNIKVTLEVTGGELVARQKGRGMKTIHRFVDETVEKMKALENIQAIGVSYAGGLELATGVADKIRAALPNVPLMFRPTDPVIATHTGEGAFAITWYVD
ncbi:DegV family protein [Lacticaseibacillus absianus]|uniref:DegV family protein n=1 Tax=Lacticaseibacillus absianus TaxID=2729623 RepID=UPI0015C6FE73|nr:DegV family protein [Lacticaseibacillus absianus]